MSARQNPPPGTLMGPLGLPASYRRARPSTPAPALREDRRRGAEPDRVCARDGCDRAYNPERRHVGSLAEALPDYCEPCIRAARNGDREDDVRLCRAWLETTTLVRTGPRGAPLGVREGA